MALSYILAFCRVTIALTFLISSISKAFDLKHFRRTIDAFDILEYKYVNPTALFLLSGEVIIALCLILGGRLLLPGFFLAMVLLLLFCIALTSVLARKISLSCNCFGPNNKPVTGSDIVRNIVFILCALTAIFILFGAQQTQYSLSFLEWITVGLSAAVFVILWIQLGNIVQFLHQK
jgi:putative oxidoreductase